MNLETRQCIIRNFTIVDAEELHETLSDEQVMQYIEPAFDLEATKEFIAEAGLCEPPLVYALLWKISGKVIGHVIFHQYEEDSCEIGWILNRNYWGRGIASELTEALVECATEKGYESCVIECDDAQIASKHIALKCGFAYEGEDDGCAVYRRML